MDEDLLILDDLVLIPTDPNIINNQRSEVHIYSFYGDYISGNHNAGYVIHDQSSNSLLVDVGTVFREAGIARGSYLIALNLFQDVWGSFGTEPVLVKEISPDRTEIHFQVQKSFLGQYQEFQSKVQELSASDILNNLVVNFGFNRIHKITNIKFDETSVYIRLYNPIDDVIVNKTKCWFDYEVIDPYIDALIATKELANSTYTILRAPNYDIDSDIISSNGTEFKNWYEILGNNLDVQQRLIEGSISSSKIDLNIDYTDFSNFVFYSSATQRLNNFMYKLQQLEEYSSSIAIINTISGSNTPFVSSSLAVNNRKVDQITSTFDLWEKWLYYDQTGSLFTHDIPGSLTP